MDTHKINTERLLNLTLTSYFFIFIALLSLSKLAGEDDLFWYLSTGRYVIQTGAVPSDDVFGFTTSGLPWIPFEWCWDIITYFLFSTGGYLFLNIFSSFILLLIFYLLLRLLLKTKLNITSCIVMLLFLAAGMLPRMTGKPHLISYLSIVLILTIILKYLLHRDNYKILYFLPLIFLLWINFHMGVLSGLILLGIFVLSEIAELLLEKKSRTGKKAILRLAVIFILSAAATLINPHGIKTYEFS